MKPDFRAPSGRTFRHSPIGADAYELIDDDAPELAMSAADWHAYVTAQREETAPQAFAYPRDSRALPALFERDDAPF